MARVRAIFFDLETSDTLTCGQIINFCFIATDTSFNVLDECSGNVKLDRLQLPKAGALLANQTRVNEHQQRATHSERSAMLAIAGFIEKQIKASQTHVALLGYNSHKFDIPFLRTSLIRNGVNPYFHGKLDYCDLFQMARFLAATHEKFPRVLREKSSGEMRLSLKLESLCQEFSLLEGAQTHHSRDDVLLTIELARVFKERFSLNVFRPQSYQIPNGAPGRIYQRVEPEYADDAQSRFQHRPYYLLSSNSRSSLFVDLERFESLSSESVKDAAQLRSALYYVGHKTGEFFVEDSDGTAASDAVRASLEKSFDGVTVENFFPPSQADVECDIYRVPFAAYDLLWQAIHEDKEQSAMSLKAKFPDGWILYIRHRLRETQELRPDSNSQMWKIFVEYCQYRYGQGVSGRRMAISHDGATLHDTYTKQFADVESRLEAAEEAQLKNEAEILSELKQYYENSEVHAALSLVS